MRDTGASETDQFTLPDAPLEDLGSELSAKTLEILGAEVARLNEEIARARRKNPQTASAPLDEQRLAFDILQRTGVGLPESTLERYIRYGDLPGKNLRFMPSPFQSVYAWVLTPVPFALVVFSSPTVRLYGVDLGTDKIGHFYQQGYEYFDRYQRARAKGLPERAAIDVAVDYGVTTENMAYGVMLSGVYSNGDLAANYAGFKFYRNLLSEIVIGDRVLPPIIIPGDGGYWTLNPERANADLLKPYVSEHLSEAYNPSEYVVGVEPIRRHVRERCQRWFAEVPGFNEQSYRAALLRVQTWYGEAYGWELPERYAATLLECFHPTPEPRRSRDRCPHQGRNPDTTCQVLRDRSVLRAPG
jgi:hypothetical protein